MLQNFSVVSLAKKVLLPALLVTFLCPGSAFGNYSTQSLAQDSSLQNVLKRALMNNPKIRANDLRVAAKAYEVEAEKMALLPTFSVSHSIINSENRSRVNEQWINNSDRIHETRATVSLNLFSGFADYYAIKAAKCRHKALKATYESTDSFIKNTRGEHAHSVMKVYLGLIQLRAATQFHKEMEVILTKLLNSTSPAGKVSVASAIQKLNLSALTISQTLEMSKKIFKFLVREEVPENLPSVEEVIQSIQIPASADEALTIGLTRSPEIVRANLGVECMELNYKSAKARMRSPSIDLSASTGSNRSSFGPSRGTEVAVTITWSFQPRTIPELEALEMQIEALREDRFGIIDDITHELSLMYPTMYDTIAVIKKQKESYETARLQAEEILKLIDQGQIYSGDSLNSALTVIETLGGSWAYLYGSERSGYAQLISTKFGIQKTIGTLFESLEGAVQSSGTISEF